MKTLSESDRQISRGFTLIEVLVVMVILMGLASIVTVNVVRHLSESRVNTAILQIGVLESGLRSSPTDPMASREGLAMRLRFPVPTCNPIHRQKQSLNFTGEDSMLTRVSAIGTRNTVSVGIHRGAGIGAGMGSTVRYSTAVNNAGNGIAIGHVGVVEHNLIRRNGRNDNDAGAAGVYASSFRSLIRNNHIVDNTIGIRIISWPNIVIGNTLRGNGTQFDIMTNNRVGEIVTVPASGAINGDSGGAGMGTTDPYANLSF